VKLDMAGGVYHTGSLVKDLTRFRRGCITVTWTNRDNFTHNVRLLDDGGEILELPPGTSVTHTFTGVGEHRYDCSFHPNDMSGVVVVTEG
jgi:hypothetical protein